LLGALIVVAVAILPLGCDTNSFPTTTASTSPAPIVFLTPVPLPSEPAEDTAVQLVPVYIATVSPAASSAATATAFPNHDRVRVRTLRYAGDFIASSVFEGADGEFYLTYFWDMGSTTYDADRLGVLDGSAIREIFAGVFLDKVTIVAEHDGYPQFSVDGGDTVHSSDNYGIWRASGAGVGLLGQLPTTYYDSPPPHPCSWCNWNQTQRVTGYCARFAGGMLCDKNAGVTFAKNGTTFVIDKNASLIGAGQHRFLLIERPTARPPLYLEGFAASD
jgi:hypothetical protein